ncbi:MAG: hypothetical protein KC766_05720 [Myxococcales bacterium]|nr:hypothetical protein [Myxococcales bacterium]
MAAPESRSRLRLLAWVLPVALLAGLAWLLADAPRSQAFEVGLLPPDPGLPYLPRIGAVTAEDVVRELNARGIAHRRTSWDRLGNPTVGFREAVRLETSQMDYRSHRFLVKYEFFAGRLYSLELWSADPAALLRALGQVAGATSGDASNHFMLRTTLAGREPYAMARDAAVYREYMKWIEEYS